MLLAVIANTNIYFTQVINQDIFTINSWMPYIIYFRFYVITSMPEGSIFPMPFHSYVVNEIAPAYKQIKCTSYLCTARMSTHLSTECAGLFKHHVIFADCYALDRNRRKKLGKCTVHLIIILKDINVIRFNLLPRRDGF